MSAVFLYNAYHFGSWAFFFFVSVFSFYFSFLDVFIVKFLFEIIEKNYGLL